MSEFFIVQKNALVPSDDASRSMVSKLRLGAIVEVEVLNPIHAKFNAKMMVAIEKLAKAQGITPKAMKTKLLVLTGRFEMVSVTPQKKVMVADSMSRSAMTQSERESFWEDLQEVAKEQILPFIDHHAAEEIGAMFEGSPDGRRADETERTGT